MKIFYLLIVPLLLASCASPSSTTQETPQATPSVVMSPSAVPTPTIGYASTAQAAEALAAEALSTAQAANLVVAGYTAESRRMDYDTLQIEQERLAWTAQVNQWTATAAPTSVPLTQAAHATAYVNNQTAVAYGQSQMTAVAHRPTQIILEAEAQAEAENADLYAKVEAFVWIAFGVFLLAAGLYILVIALMAAANKLVGASARQAESAQEQDDAPAGYIPFRQTSPTELVRAEIDCAPKQLLVFAEGVRIDRMSLAFGQWEGTIVHKSLNEIRAFMIHNGFARVVIGTNGQLNPTPEGEAFLDQVIEHKGPPPPFKCVQNDPPLVHDRENHGHETVGESQISAG